MKLKIYWRVFFGLIMALIIMGGITTSSQTQVLNPFDVVERN
jgi:hypothetical protein